MAAPERFAESSDSSCTAGTVHTWPITTFRCVAEFGRYRGNIGLSPAERPEDLWVHGLATSRRKIALSALWSTVLGDAKPAGDDRRGLPSVAMLE